MTPCETRREAGFVVELERASDNRSVADLTFDQLQTRLVPLWKSIERMNPVSYTHSPSPRDA
jgi:DNA phosphorothioation-dependent restriction protein DptG